MIENLLDSLAYWRGRDEATDSIGEDRTDPDALAVALRQARAEQHAHPLTSDEYDVHAGRASVYRELLER